MVNTKLAAFACALAVTTASPGFAQGNKTGTSAARAKAIHACSISAARYPQYLWGVWEIQIYRACMARRGQKE